LEEKQKKFDEEKIFGVIKKEVEKEQKDKSSTDSDVE